MITAFTITARNYLGMALTAARSYLRHNPESNFYICIVDGHDEVDLPIFPRLEYIYPSEFMQEELLLNFAMKYNVTEFSTSIKPFLFKHLICIEPESQILCYLDPDFYILANISEIFNENNNATLYLTPHLLYPSINFDHTYPEYKHLWEGIFNLGFCGIRIKNKSSVEMILNWWSKRLTDHCYADSDDGLHTDQKWMDYAPVYFENDLHIVRNDGVNVAHYNLNERVLSRRSDVIYSNNKKLIIYHFSGFDYGNKVLTKRSDFTINSLPFREILHDLIHNYSSELDENKYSKLINIKYKYNYFSDGSIVSPFIRRLYRSSRFSQLLDNPFGRNSDFFVAVSSKKINEYTELAHSGHPRSTIKNIKVYEKTVNNCLSIFLKLFGIRRYILLLKMFRVFSRYESNTFLIQQKKK